MIKTIAAVLAMILLFWIWSSNTSEAFDPISAHTAMLSESEGYFKHAGGTGGEGGRVVYVTNLFNQGPGSLRFFAEMEEPLIILFDIDGQIDVTGEAIKVESNKTIWGRHRDGTGANIFIHPTSTISAALKISGPRGNIIINNLLGDAPGPDDAAPDFIIVRGPGGPVWIHHITVNGGCGPIGSDCHDMDGFVDVKRVGVTISWNRVLNWDNVHLVRPFITGDPDTESLIDVVSFIHNLFRNNKGRMP